MEADSQLKNISALRPDGRGPRLDVGKRLMSFDFLRARAVCVGEVMTTRLKHVLLLLLPPIVVELAQRLRRTIAASAPRAGWNAPEWEAVPDSEAVWTAHAGWAHPSIVDTQLTTRSQVARPRCPGALAWSGPSLRTCSVTPRRPTCWPGACPSMSSRNCSGMPRSARRSSTCIRTRMLSAQPWSASGHELRPGNVTPPGRQAAATAAGRIADPLARAIDYGLLIRPAGTRRPRPWLLTGGTRCSAMPSAASLAASPRPGTAVACAAAAGAASRRADKPTSMPSPRWERARRTGPVTGAAGCARSPASNDPSGRATCA